MLSDLSAALLVRAERTGSADDLLEAADAASAATAIDSASLSGRYNLALALDRLGLADQAAHAWAEYLVLDSTSRWAGEAREGRDRAVRWSQERTSDSSPQDERVLGFDHVLGDWGRAVLAGDRARAAQLLDQTEILGLALERPGGDATLIDAVRAVQASTGADRVALATAHRDFADGRAAFLAGDPARAARILGRVRITVQPLATWAAVYRAATMLQTGHAAQALPRIDALIPRTRPARWPALAGQVQWARGTALLRSGRYEESIGAFRAAESLFQRAGESENTGALYVLVGDAEYALGVLPDAQQSFHQAIVTLRPFRGSVWLHNALLVWAELASDGPIRAAALLQDEGVAVATRSGSAGNLAEARIARSRLRLMVGDTAGAVADIRAGGTLVDGMTPSPIGGWLHANWGLAEVAAGEATGPDVASQLDSAVAFFEGIHNPALAFQALVARSDVAFARGDTSAAAQSLERALALLDEQRAEIAHAPLRVTFLDAARRAVDRLAMLRLATPAVALGDVERGRACLTRAERRAVPPGVTVVDYALVGDTLLTWTVRDGRTSLHRATESGARLPDRIARVASVLEGRGAEHETDDDLADLYEWLIRPVEGDLGPEGRPLVIISDGELAGVPFAALRDRRSGRYLIEAHSIRVATCLDDLENDAAPPLAANPPVLIVADPAFDSRGYPGLPRLAGAREEARAIAAVYSSVRLLADSMATVSAVRAALPAAGIVHFAGHAVLDDDRPDQSYLVLADSDHAGRAARLTAAELAQLDLRGVRLVVLSACETATPRPGRSGGLAGLTGAFASAGAGGVLGSLWWVDDRSTEALMTAFHRAYAGTGDGSAALRSAQLQLMHGPDPALRSPAAWAAFRYVGN